ncbi:uncharacterized protein LOC124156644 [Ischnura elegans]|uniref:uncharacterized protein LOC124156644 n=1 Tax=Ischnura elegans TaxID=197161 RepID=UPI001ED8B001|nr:uncharacterized protein LOC124156644 [Ischnura elegans]
MWVGLFICLAFLYAKIDAHQTSELATEVNSKINFIDPNDWSIDGYSRDKGSVGGTPYDNEISHLGSNLPGTEVAKKSLENTILEYVTIRRFVNLLLRRAEIEDVAGNIVPLESISSSKNDQLVMSIVVFARPQEIQSLLDFGLKRSKLYLRQIDEILSNLTSTPEPDFLLSRCKHSYLHWIQGFGTNIYQAFAKIDYMVVVYILTVCYIILTLKRVLNREGSWKSIIVCFFLPSVVWEFSKRLEEEKVKQYSEELRLGKIPDHCLGLESQNWWERIFSGSGKEECHEYHMARMSHSALKVSIFKVALVHVEELLGVVVKFIRDLTASYSDDWWFTNILMRTVAWSCLSFVVIAPIAITILAKQPFFRWVSPSTGTAPPVNGSRVEAIKDEPEEVVKPPPRRKRARQRVPALGYGRPGAHSGVGRLCAGVAAPTDGPPPESLSSTGDSGADDVDGTNGCPFTEEEEDDKERGGIMEEKKVAEEIPEVKPLEKDRVS